MTLCQIFKIQDLGNFSRALVTFSVYLNQGHRFNSFSDQDKMFSDMKNWVRRVCLSHMKQAAGDWPSQTPLQQQENYGSIVCRRVEHSGR